MLLPLVMFLVLHLAAVPAVQPTDLTGPVIVSSGVQFSGVFSSSMVLQRAPASAAVYGFCGNNGEGARVLSRCNFTAGAVVEVTVSGGESSPASPSSPPYSLQTAIAADGTWKALLRPTTAGGSYSITVSCLAGCGNSSASTIAQVTFGDVFYCSGQSNMELPLHYTFSRNKTLDAIIAGRYTNIRMMLWSRRDASEPTYVVNASRWGTASHSSDPGFVWITATKAASTPYPMRKNAWGSYNWAYNSTVLEQFSATCFYFAQALTDELIAATANREIVDVRPVPLGLIGSSAGGTVIEAWSPNSTLDACPTAERGAGNAVLYNGMVAPFVNMTIKGFAWYQVNSATASVVSSATHALPLTHTC